MRAILSLAAFAGLRAGEIASLRVASINFADARIVIPRTKGAGSRAVPMSGDVATIVARITEKRHPDEMLFPTLHGTACAPGGAVTHAANRYLRKRGLDASLHRLRAFFATQTYDQTGDINAVRRLLGHRDPNTTVIYTAVRRESVLDALHALERVVMSAAPTVAPCRGCSPRALARAFREELPELAGEHPTLLRDLAAVAHPRRLCGLTAAEVDHHTSTTTQLADLAGRPVPRSVVDVVFCWLLARHPALSAG